MDQGREQRKWWMVVRFQIHGECWASGTRMHCGGQWERREDPISVLSYSKEVSRYLNGKCRAGRGKNTLSLDQARLVCGGHSQMETPGGPQEMPVEGLESWRGGQMWEPQHTDGVRDVHPKCGSHSLFRLSLFFFSSCLIGNFYVEMKRTWRKSLHVSGGLSSLLMVSRSEDSSTS